MNIVIITLDALRWDVTVDTDTPRIDKLVAQGNYTLSTDSIVQEFAKRN